MTANEKLVVDALKRSFVDRITSFGGKVAKGEVTMPPDDIWLRYAKAAIDALGGSK